MTMGERIKRIRKQKGLTQHELGELLGVTQSMIAAYENNARNPKFETIKKIAAALGTSTSTLMGSTQPTEQFRQMNHNLEGFGNFLLESAKEHDKEYVKYYLEYLAFIINHSNNNESLSLKKSEENIKNAILDSYNKLNITGKQIAADCIEGLTNIEKYTILEDSKDNYVYDNKLNELNYLIMYFEKYMNWLNINDYKETTVATSSNDQSEINEEAKHDEES